MTNHWPRYMVRLWYRGNYVYWRNSRCAVECFALLVTARRLAGVLRTDYPGLKIGVVRLDQDGREIDTGY